MSKPQNRVRLTAGRVDAFACPAGKSQAFLWDTEAPALALRVTPTGRKTYVFESRLNGTSLRVNIGTAALENPQWCARIIAEHGDKIAIGLDVRGTTLSARGWTRDGGELFEVLARLDAEGCARYVVTDVNRDGTMTGPNLGLLRQVCAATDQPVIASGGVSNLDDLRALADLHDIGVEGAIVGKALYAGAFTLPEALAAVAAEEGPFEVSEGEQ